MNYKIISILLTCILFSNTMNAQVQLGETKTQSKDKIVYNYRNAAGSVWAPYLCISPDGIYFLMFDSPSQDLFEPEIRSSCRFYLSKDKKEVVQILTALIDKITKLNRDEAFPVKDYLGNQFTIKYWIKGKHFYLTESNVTLSNAYGKKEVQDVDYYGHVTSLKKIIEKQDKWKY